MCRCSCGTTPARFLTLSWSSAATDRDTSWLAVESMVFPRAPADHNKSIMVRENQKARINTPHLNMLPCQIFSSMLVRCFQYSPNMKWMNFNFIVIAMEAFSFLYIIVGFYFIKSILEAALSQTLNTHINYLAIYILPLVRLYKLTTLIQTVFTKVQLVFYHGCYRSRSQFWLSADTFQYYWKISPGLDCSRNCRAHLWAPY